MPQVLQPNIPHLRTSATSYVLQARSNPSGAGSHTRSSAGSHLSGAGSRAHQTAEAAAERKSTVSEASAGGSSVSGTVSEASKGRVNPVDIGLKVANEIIGLHSQAAAAGRALAHNTRHMELVQEENAQLKVSAGCWQQPAQRCTVVC